MKEFYDSLKKDGFHIVIVDHPIALINAFDSDEGNEVLYRKKVEFSFPRNNMKITDDEFYRRKLLFPGKTTIYSIGKHLPQSDGGIIFLIGDGIHNIDIGMRISTIFYVLRPEDVEGSPVFRTMPDSYLLDLTRKSFR